MSGSHVYTGFGVCQSGCTSFCWTKTGCIFDVCQSGCTHALMQDRTYKEKRPCGGCVNLAVQIWVDQVLVQVLAEEHVSEVIEFLHETHLCQSGRTDLGGPGFGTGFGVLN